MRKKNVGGRHVQKINKNVPTGSAGDDPSSTLRGIRSSTKLHTRLNLVIEKLYRGETRLYSRLERFGTNWTLFRCSCARDRKLTNCPEYINDTGLPVFLLDLILNKIHQELFLKLPKKLKNFIYNHKSIQNKINFPKNAPKINRGVTYYIRFINTPEILSGTIPMKYPDFLKISLAEICWSQDAIFWKKNPMNSAEQVLMF